ncbi:TPA: hypothetical protein RTF98_000656 [Campylobacter jejuni]|nr:hypothetical protein [Campylobacter jejuni]HDZ4936687.1 hypothetical protein [Campylobacter jejuni]HDZ4940250.1 hypothetical protein [Campylobacter jejuni]HDZ4943619.1 hypothetical protein [Campylobacter jejuni]HDZ4944952.1 hypothetical protein [Campylobacter jejuni]
MTIHAGIHSSAAHIFKQNKRLLNLEDLRDDIV